MRRILIVLLVLAMIGAACSDEGAGVTTAAVAGDGSTTTTAYTTTSAPTTTAAPATTAAVAAALDPVGIWQGEIAGLRIQIIITADGSSYQAALDSIDQGVTGIPATLIGIEDGAVRIEFDDIGGAFAGSPDPSGETITGTWEQGGAELPLILTRSDEALAYDRPQEPQPPYPYTVEEVAFDNPATGNLLAGTLTIPEGEGPFPAVVLISGSGPQDRNEELLGHKPFLVIADHLARNGIAALRYDDRGVGESGGEFAGATTAAFSTDAAAALGYLRDRPEVDPSAAGLIGHSEGGLIAPMVARDGPGIAFMILLAGPGQRGAELLKLQTELLWQAEGAPADYIEWQLEWVTPVIDVAASGVDDAAAREQIAEIIEQAAATAPEEITAADLEAEAVAAYLDPWMRYFLAYDPAPALVGLRMPVLALLGGLDLQVPAEPNRELLEEALSDNPDHRVETLDGLNHLFQSAGTGAVSEYGQIPETLAPEVLDLITTWILERFG